MSTADAEICARLGANVGGGSEDEIKTLSEIGRRLGFIIRLTDEVKDTLNLEGNLVLRLKNESVPLPILHGAQFSQDNYLIVKSILEQQSNKLSIIEIKKMLIICTNSKSFQYVLDLAKQNAVENFISVGPVSYTHLTLPTTPYV